MTNPTSNFGWQMPTSTDLVTDLPADFEVFGQAVDTDFVDLLGGTTGQVLSKTSATDLDFTWVTANPGDITGVTAGTGITGGGTSGTVTVTNDMATTITAAGDIVVGTGSGTYDNLPIGTTAQVLTADTTVSPYKVKWAAPPGGSFNTGYAYTATNENTTSSSYVGLTTATAVTVTTGTKALVSIKAALGNDSAGDGVWGHAAFAISGATTVAAADEWSISHYSQGGGQWIDEKGATFVITGLTAGSNVFTMKFSAAGGYTTPAGFAKRSISVVDLGS